jgi:hypothetical protein
MRTSNGLGEFLKARRAGLSPLAVGLPEADRRRRVAGLRREEVAVLAAISTDYYTRLDQGRITPSTSVLASLVRGLHLDDAQRDYLYELAGRQVSRPRRTARKVQPQLLTVMNELTVTPGMVLGRHLDILAWNPMAAALLNTDFGAIPEKKRNYVRHIFTNPAMRSLYPDWEASARDAVAGLRRRAAARPDDPGLSTLVAIARRTALPRFVGDDPPGPAHVRGRRLTGPRTGPHSCGARSPFDRVGSQPEVFTIRENGQRRRSGTTPGHRRFALGISK